MQAMNMQSYCHITFANYSPRLPSQNVAHSLAELSVISEMSAIGVDRGVVRCRLWVNS